MHLKERVRLSHSTKADFITTELTNRNQQEKCCAFLNLTQSAHKSLFAKCFGYKRDPTVTAKKRTIVP